MINMDGMHSMMAWMMGFGLLGWILIIGLLVAILVVLVRILGERESGGRERPGDQPTKPHAP